MFQGILTYNQLSNGYHANNRKLVCFISDNIYREDFWTDKRVKFYTRIVDFENRTIQQINYRFKIQQKVQFSDLEPIHIDNIQIEKNTNQGVLVKYKLQLPAKFGIKSFIEFENTMNSEIELNSNQKDYIRIWSKHDRKSNFVWETQKSKPLNRNHRNKEYQLIANQPKSLKHKNLRLLNETDFKTIRTSIETYIAKEQYKNHKWFEPLKSKLISFHTDELNQELDDEQKEKILAFHNLYFGTLSDEQYRIEREKYRKFENKYDQ